MNLDSSKLVAGTGIIAIMAVLQGFAWYTNQNSSMFALTSLVIGGIAGALFGISFVSKASK